MITCQSSKRLYELKDRFTESLDYLLATILCKLESSHSTQGPEYFSYAQPSPGNCGFDSCTAFQSICIGKFELDAAQFSGTTELTAKYREIGAESHTY